MWSGFVNQIKDIIRESENFDLNTSFQKKTQVSTRRNAGHGQLAMSQAGISDPDLPHQQKCA
jgi:hypothetical protein